MVKKHDEIVVTIASLNDDGIGVGEGVVVPFTMPGDAVRVQLMRKRNGLWRGLFQEVVSPASDRVPSRCVHFGRCGGCRWQHISYEQQLSIKEAFLRRHFGLLLEDGVVVHPVVGCIPPWNYRNKMEFTFSQNGAGERFLGLVLETGRGRAFHLTECHLCPDWCVSAAAAVRQWWQETGLEAYYPPKDKGTFRTLTLRDGVRTGDRMVILTVSGNPDYALNQGQITAFVNCIKESVTPTGEGRLSIFLRIQQIGKGRATNFFEMHLHGPEHVREQLELCGPEGQVIPLTFWISPQAFFQPNTRQAERLYSLAMRLAEIPPNAVVYDLYCGTGTLGICAGHWARKVIGIELSPDAVLDARMNAKENGLDNVTIIGGDVGKELKKLRESGADRPDVVLVDPPRAGLDPLAMGCILEILPRKIVYISCNPVTQAVNVKQFVEQGYRLLSLQPVDQFPHTRHLENIAVLERRP